MIRIRLPEAELESLERVLRSTDAKLRHRVQIVLMAHRGRPHPEIASDTGTSQRSVERGLNAYLDGGLDRLLPRKAKGAVPRLTEDLAPILRQWVIDGPEE
jgi:transposase